MRLIKLLYILPLYVSMVFAGDDVPAPAKALPRGALVFSGAALESAGEKMALSPDGTRITTIGASGHILLLDVATLKIVKDIAGLAGVGGIDFSADGKNVLTAGPNNIIQVWNLETEKATRTFTGHTAEVHAVAVSPDGSRVASTDSGGTLRIWDFADGKLLHTLTGKHYPDDPMSETIITEGLAFSPDGRFIVTEANDVKARVWDAVQGVELRMVPDHDGTTAAVSISPSGTRAATTRSGGVLRVWRIDSGEILRAITGHDDDLTCSVFAPDEFTIFTGSRDATIRQWDIETGIELRRFRLSAPAGLPSALAISTDGKRLYSLSPDVGLVAWSTAGAPMTDNDKIGEPSYSSLEHAWLALSSTNYDTRTQALLYMLKSPDSNAVVKFIGEKLNYGGIKEADRNAQNELVAQLDDPAFAIRLKASEELKKLGPAARETLVLALKNASSEVRTKVSELLRDIGGPFDGRIALAAELLGLMHSPEAKELLTSQAAKEGVNAGRAKSVLARFWGK